MAVTDKKVTPRQKKVLDGFLGGAKTKTSPDKKTRNKEREKEK